MLKFSLAVVTFPLLKYNQIWQSFIGLTGLFTAIHLFLVLAGLLDRVAGKQTCFIEQQTNSTQDHPKWNILIDKDDRCNCTTILPKPSQSMYLQPLHPWKCGGNSKRVLSRIFPSTDRYWFTDQPHVLVEKSVWNTEKLKYLLGCPYTGRYFNTSVVYTNFFQRYFERGGGGLVGVEGKFMPF